VSSAFHLPVHLDNGHKRGRLQRRHRFSGLESIALREARRLHGLMPPNEQPLAQSQRAYRFIDVVEWMRRGGGRFSGTNSLVAFAVLLIRAYGDVFSLSKKLPGGSRHYCRMKREILSVLVNCRPTGEPCWIRETLVVLYGPSVASPRSISNPSSRRPALGNVADCGFPELRARPPPLDCQAPRDYGRAWPLRPTRSGPAERRHWPFYPTPFQ